MRIGLTKYGWPQVVMFPSLLIAAMVVCLLTGIGVMAVVCLELVLGAVLVLVLMFFRDPERIVPQDSNILLAPADGTITDIETVEENAFIGSAALRIGIFLSIFDVHINRAPCRVKIEGVSYKKGSFKNAQNLESGRVNESNDLTMVRLDEPEEKLIVRQISGAIARRIVCSAGSGKELTAGEKFGMIKFGSRTELYLPIRDNVACLVRIGDKVKAGVSVLVRYE